MEFTRETALFLVLAAEIALVGLGFLVVRLWRALPVTLRERLAHGGVQLFIAVDQLVNVLANPFSLETWADETISARSGRLGHRSPYKYYKVIIDALFFWQGPNHCVNAHLKEMTRYQSPPETRNNPKANNAISNDSH